MLKQGFGFYVEEMKGENLLYRLGGHHLNGRDLEATAAAPSADLLKQEYPGSQSGVGAAVREPIAPLFRDGVLLKIGGFTPVEGSIAGRGPKRRTPSAVLKPVPMAPTHRPVPA